MALLHGRALRAPSLNLGKIRSGKVLLSIAMCFVVAVALLQVHQLSRVTTTGYELNQLNYVRTQKQAENHQLEAEVASLSSLGGVDWNARVRLHMEPPKHVLYMDVNHPVPERESLPTRFQSDLGAPKTAVADTETEPFWKRVLRMLPFF